MGKLGLPCAEVMAGHFKVSGYDPVPVRSNSIFLKTSVAAVCADSDVIFIAVPTPHETGYDGSRPSSHLPARDFDYSYVENTLTEINRAGTAGKTIVLISTVLPGTIRGVLQPLVPDARLIYNPYLIAMGTVKEDMIRPEMIIIGCEDGQETEGVRVLKRIYEAMVVEGARYETGTWEEAESIKIFYNTFISAKLGLVNMIQDVAERIGHMNVDIVTDALKRSNYRITGPSYMKAGLGDGGPCHPRDNIALRHLAERLELGYDIFGAIMHSRELQAMHLAERLVGFGLPVIILGQSYKPNVTLTDGSYAVLVGHYAASSGAPVYYDATPDNDVPYCYLIGHAGKFDDHPFSANSVVVDPWRSFRSERDDLTIVWYGCTR